MKLWGGRFEGGISKKMDQFNASLPFDINLMEYDIEGSLAHVKMLGRQGIILESEAEDISTGLKEVRAELREELKNGSFNEEEAEDIHTLVEMRLTDKIGDLGGKLHTGRSRNDQVALDMRLYLRDQNKNIKELLLEFMETLLELAEEHKETVMPGYTHLQRAQALTFGHHLLAYYFKLKRDYNRLCDADKRINVSPLGSGALAGSSFDLDREWTAAELGFDSASMNSLDGVSDRDFVLEFLSAAANIMIHLSRLSEEVILWNSSEFSFVKLADQYTTGSSIMPQKKNPDLAELVRGKTGRVVGNLNQLMMTIKGLPLAYNKDLQEDKEGLFDTVETLKIILELYPEMLKTMHVNKEKMKKAASTGFLNATELADYLAEKGIPFRKAHQIVGKAVLYADGKNKELDELKAEEWEEILGEIIEIDQNELQQILSVEAAVNSHSTLGGPAFKETKKIAAAEKEFLRSLKQ